MKLKDLKDLIDVLPEASIQVEGSVICLLDKKGVWFAEINPYEERFALYESYKHFDKINKRIEDKGNQLFDRTLAQAIEEEFQKV